MRLFLSITFCTLVGLEAPTYAQTSATGIPYFQQHVHYTLAATFHDDYSYPWIEGTGTLDYTNNSPDTLHELYFHLYWNLFKNEEYGKHDRDHDSDSKIGPRGIEITKLTAGGDDSSYEKAPLNVRREGIFEVDTIRLKFEIDNTIMRVFLNQPLLPGATAKIAFDWNALFPHFGERTTWGWHDSTARNFATAQWYPQVCVYDNHGWHPDQYIGMGEFYTDYGAFDVSLTLPTRFSTVMTTGWLENPSDVLTDAVRTHLDFAKAHPDAIFHIADNSDYRYQPISTSEPMRIWKFHADSVRDFAWCADEAYIWDAVFDGGVMHHAVYWNRSREFWSAEAAKIVLITEQTNSAFAGKYAYPNMILCETYEGGMEYPGIVFVGPSEHESTYHWQHNTMMHELGHEWYPMMMGSNETDYGYMDEGFNTFITTFVQERYFGRWNNSYGPGLGFNDDERTANYRTSILQELSGNAEPSKQKADMYLSYRDYADATYPHTSSVFFMLRYTMGDRAFDDLMKLYYERWRFKHPYPDDLLNAAEDIERTEGDTNRVRARGDLRWFFNEWFEQTWKLDYAISRFHVKGNTVKITIAKKQRAVMPLDIVFTFADKTTEQKWIPVDDWLRTVADERTYTYTFSTPPVYAVINPSLELLDVDRLNNVSTHLPPSQVDVFPKIFGDVKPIDMYAWRLAPFAAPLTADFHNWSLGYTILGSYLDRSDRIAMGIRYGIGPNSSSAEVFQYHTVQDFISPWTDMDISFVFQPNNANLIGQFGSRISQVVTVPGSTSPRHIFNAGYDLTFPPPHVNTFVGTTFYPDGSFDLGHPIPLNRGFVGYTFHDESGFNSFTINAQAEDGLGDPRTTYTKLAGVIDDRINLTSDWNAFLRLFGGSMQPIGGSIPSETEFQLASASEVDQISDLYGSNFGSGVRDKIRNAAASGPLVRGYLLDGNPVGRVAASGSFELGNRSLFPFSFLGDIPYIGDFFNTFGLTLFADAGLVTDAFCTCNLRSDLKSDAGVGLRFFGFDSRPIRAWDLDLERTELQLDFPLYLDKPAAGESNLKFRFMAIVRQNF